MANPTTVTYAVTELDTSSRAGVPVTAILIGGADRSDAASVVTGMIQTSTAEDGSFSFSLLPNSVYRQAGSYYKIKIAGGPVYAVVVPVSDTPVSLWDIRVDPRTLTPVPAATPPIYLTRAERGAAGGVASLDPVTGLVPLDQLPAIAGGGVASVNEIEPDGNGDVTLTPADIGADAAGTGTAAAAAAVAAHVAAVDPHPQYLTGTEGASAFDPLGAATAAAAAAVATHRTEADAHAISRITGLQTALNAKATKMIKRPAYVTSGNVNLSTGTSSWGVLATFPTLSIPAQAGDWVELDGTMFRQANASLLADLGVITGGTTIKRWLGNGATSTPSNGYEGDPALYHTATNLNARSGARGFVVTAGEIENGNVTFAVLCRVTGAGSASILADAATPFYWQATNFGVCDVA